MNLMKMSLNMKKILVIISHFWLGCNDGSFDWFCEPYIAYQKSYYYTFHAAINVYSSTTCTFWKFIH